MTSLLILDNLKLFGIELFDQKGFGELILRFSFNMLMVLAIVRMIYYPATRRKDYLFTYILISVVIFLLCFLLGSVKLQIGFALGLFAIFGIIRYRTESLPIKEMTYLFIVIGVSVINALTNKKVSYAEILFTNLAIILITYSLEKIWLLRHESVKLVYYDKIDLVKIDKRKELIEDLQVRTGLKISRVDIGRIDFLRDSARIMVYYYDDENITNLAEESDFVSKSDNDD